MSCGKRITQPAVVSKEMAAGFFVLKEPKLRAESENLQESIRENRAHIKRELFNEHDRNPLLTNAELIDQERDEFPGWDKQLNAIE